MADRRYHVASVMIGMISSLLTLLQAHLTLLRRHLDFTRREQDILRFLTLPASGKTKIKRLSRSPPKPRRLWTRPGRTSVWWDNFVARKVVEEEWRGEFRMSRTSLYALEGTKAFSKRIRRCSVDGRKRYENDKCGRKSF